jgi:hypothetical protein
VAEAFGGGAVEKAVVLADLLGESCDGAAERCRQGRPVTMSTAVRFSTLLGVAHARISLP